MTHMLARLLQSLGPFDVEIADDGPSALEKSETFLPDILFIDISMPGMDGFTVARRLRAKADFRDSMLVAFTGLDREVDRRRMRDAGFDEHLRKPMSLDILTQILDRVRNPAQASESTLAPTSPLDDEDSDSGTD
jgi:CheY-like chemotaxis protein